MKEDSKTQSVKFILLGILMFGLFAGCNGQKKAANDTSAETTPDSPLTLVIQENYAPTDSVETHVIKSGKALSKFFSKVNMTRKPGIAVPKVDFSKDMVVIYCAGIDGNGTQPQLAVAEENDTELVLGMHNVENTDKDVRTANPFSVYVMPTTSKSIRFQAIE